MSCRRTSSSAADPNVAASQAVYEERFTAAMRARDLETQLNRMMGTILDLDGQIDGLLESIEGKDLANEEQVRAVAGDAQGQLTAVSSEVRRPPGSMSYRDWPRLIEQLRNISRAVSGPAGEADGRADGGAHRDRGRGRSACAGNSPAS